MSANAPKLTDALSHLCHAWDGHRLTLTCLTDLQPHYADVKISAFASNNLEASAGWFGERPEAMSYSGTHEDMALIKSWLRRPDPLHIKVAYEAMQMTGRLADDMVPVMLMVVTATKVYGLEVTSVGVDYRVYERAQPMALGRNRELIQEFLGEELNEPTAMGLMAIQALAYGDDISVITAAHPGTYPADGLARRCDYSRLKRYHSQYALVKATRPKLSDAPDDDGEPETVTARTRSRTPRASLS